MDTNRTLLIGLGNPLLGDDGVGWRVVQEVERFLTQSSEDSSESDPGSRISGVEFDCLSLGGLSLMERMIGYPRAILVDAMFSGQNPVGTMVCFPLEDLPNRSAGHLGSAHDTSLQNAIQVGRTMGATLPGEILVVAIEAKNVYEFSEELTPAVADAVPHAVKMVLEKLES